ncbi:MAG: hypothetical protein AB1589_17520 [Cyanobacteriota bacterium]
MPIPIAYSSKIIQAVLLTLLTGCGFSFPTTPSSKTAVTVKPPSTPSLPNSLPKPRYHGGLDWHKNRAVQHILDETGLSLGVGQLRPKDLSSFRVADWENPNSLVGSGWLGKVRLPIYSQPNGELWGWLAQGWLLRQTNSNKLIVDSRSLTVIDIVYKGTVNSLAVLDIRQDGWFKFRYAQPDSGDEGVGWAHLSHLKLSKISLIVEPWQEWLTQQKALHFRDNVFAALHSQPTTDSQMLLKIPEDIDYQFYKVEPLTFQGDWVRVRLTSTAAVEHSYQNRSSYEGWLRWLDPQQGPLLWYYSD